MAFTLRPDAERQARWQAAADADGRSLANWISRVCDQAAQDLEGVGVDLDRFAGTGGRNDELGGMGGSPSAATGKIVEVPDMPSGPVATEGDIDL